MLLYWAPGEGLGHVTRARRVLETLGLAARAAIATPCNVAERISDGVPIVRGSLAELIASLYPERIIADTFPAGLRGELAEVNVPVDYVGRLLQWETYRSVVNATPPHFETAYLVEELTEPHMESVRGNSTNIVTLDLGALASTPAGSAPSRRRSEWLVVHSGPEAEVRELIAYARDLQRIERTSAPIAVATLVDLVLPDGCVRVDALPALPLFASAERIITAAGFNVMLETRPWREKHAFLPFPRRFDDQFTRAARAKSHEPASSMR